VSNSEEGEEMESNARVMGHPNSKIGFVAAQRAVREERRT
jgi:hypothetical protein